MYTHPAKVTACVTDVDKPTTLISCFFMKIDCQDLPYYKAGFERWHAMLQNIKHF